MNLIRKGRLGLIAAFFAGLASLTAVASNTPPPASVNLAWNPSSSPDVAGYRLYEGVVSGTYTTKLDVGNATTANVSLIPGTAYFFAIAAYDRDGLESALSAEISFNAPVNVSIPHGYSLLSNPLDAGDNSVSNLFRVAVRDGSGPAAGASVLTWSGAGLTVNANDIFTGDWWINNTDLSPGTGFFFYNPGAPFTNTFVGTVPKGTLTTTLPKGYSLKGSMVPLTGYLMTDLGYTNAAPGDVVYLWSSTGFVVCPRDQFDGSWWTSLPPPFTADPVKGPLISIATGFFYRNNSGAPIPVKLNFTVQ